MIGQTDDLQKLVVLNNDVVMQMVQFVGCLHAVQSGLPIRLSPTPTICSVHPFS